MTTSIDTQIEQRRKELGLRAEEQMEIFSENLKRLMDQKGVDQRTVADAIGVSCATLSYYATAKKYPRLKNMLALCDFFGVDLDELRNPKEAPMPIPIDAQIESLEAAWEREIARCRLGASPYDDDDLPEVCPSASCEIDRDE